MNRYDPRDVGDRADSWDRNFGSRGGTSERDRNDERDPRDIFTRDLDLPRGRERRPAGDRDRVYEIDGARQRIMAMAMGTAGRPDGDPGDRGGQRRPHVTVTSQFGFAWIAAGR